MGGWKGDREWGVWEGADDIGVGEWRKEGVKVTTHAVRFAGYVEGEARLEWGGGMEWPSGEEVRGDLDF